MAYSILIVVSCLIGGLAAIFVYAAAARIKTFPWPAFVRYGVITAIVTWNALLVIIAVELSRLSIRGPEGAGILKAIGYPILIVIIPPSVAAIVSALCVGPAGSDVRVNRGTTDFAIATIIALGWFFAWWFLRDRL
jgi:hypothetical protein